MLLYRLFYPSQLIRIGESYLSSSKSELKRIEIEVNAAEDEKTLNCFDWKIKIVTRKKDDTREDYEKWELSKLLLDECLNKNFILRIEAGPKSHR